MSDRKNIIVGNWKMNLTPAEATAFAEELKSKLGSLPDNTEAGVCPTLLALTPVIEALKDTPVKVGAQAGYPEPTGAFTGQVSMEMIAGAGADYCLIGHSEQRQYFGETDASVNARTKAALKAGLTPIVCIGELLEERESGVMEEVLKRQIKEGLGGVEISSAGDLIVAYEPVWAIGTGKTATPDMAQEAHAFCRKILCEVFGELANGITIQYGGSAKPENAGELMAQEDINGLLVGGASLKVDSFLAIVKA